jgi:hypothetical protein
MGAPPSRPAGWLSIRLAELILARRDVDTVVSLAISGRNITTERKDNSDERPARGKDLFKWNRSSRCTGK